MSVSQDLNLLTPNRVQVALMSQLIFKDILCILHCEHGLFKEVCGCHQMQVSGGVHASGNLSASAIHQHMQENQRV